MEQELIERGKYLVAKMNESYRELLEEDEDTLIDDAMDGWIANRMDVVAVLLATGLEDEALQAVFEELEMCVRDNVVVAR